MPKVKPSKSEERAGAFEQGPASERQPRGCPFCGGHLPRRAKRCSECGSWLGARAVLIQALDSVALIAAVVIVVGVFLNWREAKTASTAREQAGVAKRADVDERAGVAKQGLAIQEPLQQIADLRAHLGVYEFRIHGPKPDSWRWQQAFTKYGLVAPIADSGTETPGEVHYPLGMDAESLDVLQGLFSEDSDLCRDLGLSEGLDVKPKRSRDKRHILVHLPGP